MKRNFFSLATVAFVYAMVFSLPAAHATGNNGGGNGGCGNGQQTNGCGSSGQPVYNGGEGGNGGTGVGVGLGIGVGQGGDAAANAVANAAAAANAAAIAAQQQAQQQAQRQQQAANAVANATGGNGEGGAGGQGGAGGNATATGNGSGNATNVNVEGARRNAPAVVVGSQNAPVIDCRRTLGFGASNTGGSVVGSGIPLWKETDCSGIMGLEAMSKAPVGIFTNADFVTVACTVEVIGTTPTCEKERQRKNAEVTPNRQQTSMLLP